MGAVCARSQVVVQAQDTNDANPDCIRFHVISGRTITDSVYLAVLRNPGAEMVAWTVHIRLEEVVEVSNPTPADVVEYLADKGNDFHDGAPNMWIHGTIAKIYFRLFFEFVVRCYAKAFCRSASLRHFEKL